MGKVYYGSIDQGYYYNFFRDITINNASMDPEITEQSYLCMAKDISGQWVDFLLYESELEMLITKPLLDVLYG